MNEKYVNFLYFTVNVIIYLLSGLATYYAFKTKFLLLLILIILTEIFLFFVLRKKFIIIKRFIINIIYIAGFLLPIAYIT